MAKRLTVGFIDDDPDLLISFDNMLAPYDCQTELYTSAEQFLKTARTSRAKCLIVDIRLSDISGIELCRHLAAGGFAIPFVFMSGDTDDVVQRQAAELGCADFLLKPFSVSRLIDAIAKATGRGPRPAAGDHGCA